MRNDLTKELAICGVHAVTALGAEHPGQIHRLFIRPDRLGEFTKVCKALAAQKRMYKQCSDAELEHICKSCHHQGVVAMIEEPVISPLTWDDLTTWAQDGKVGVVLDSVGNDHNLGAIVRSAAFFGVHFVVVSAADAEARLTTSAYRVAEGGMEFVTFRVVRDTAAFLKDASKKVVSIGAEPRSRWRLQDIEGILQEKAGHLQPPPAPGQSLGICLVVGNEEKGLPPAVKEACSALVRIPGTGAVESLNVAQAATLFFHALYH